MEESGHWHCIVLSVKMHPLGVIVRSGDLLRRTGVESIVHRSEYGLADGDEIQINFSGSDELDEAVTIVIGEAKERTASTFLATPPEGHIRIANQNTLWQGIADPVRSGFFKRLLNAANADIYCFEEEPFWPGRLDLITYDPSVLWPAAGFIFDTARLSKLTLENLGLQATDSLASDHLLLVADFRCANCDEANRNRPTAILSAHFS